MKILQILKFKERQTNNIYSLNTNTGDYIDYNNNKFHLYSFFGKDVIVISILDKLRDITFSVGDSVTTPLGPKEIISMQIVGGAENTTVQFTLFTNNASNTILMRNCTKVVPVIPVAPTIKKTNNSEFEELQQRIIKDFDAKTLKFAVFVRKKSETFEEFKTLFFGRNNEFDTVYSENNNVQTTKGRRRSLGDIFMICKYYYPNISLSTVIAWLYSPEYFKGQYCSEVKKRVWRIDYNVMNHENFNDEYGKTTNYYKTLLNK